LVFSSLSFLPSAVSNPVAVADTSNMCLDEAFHLEHNGPINCTANEAPVMNANFEILDGCDYIGDTATVHITSNFDSNAERYDVGLWMGVTNGGMQSYEWSCLATNLPSSLSLDGDACGDLQVGTTSDVEVWTFTFQCLDPDNNQRLDIDYIMSWKTPWPWWDNNVCSTVTQTIPSTSSKCKENFWVDIPVYVPPSEANLKIIKDAPISAFAGDTISYSLTITNDGPSASTGIITDTFPTWFTYVSSSDGSVSAGVFSYSRLMLSGESYTVIITGTVTWLSWASIKNTATVASSITDTNPADNTDDATTTITQIPYIPTTDLEIQKTTQSTAMSGDSIAYTLTLTNNGPDGATGIITDTFPSWFTYVSSSPEASVVDGVLTYSTYLENGSSVVITITGTVTWLSWASIKNTATVASSITDTNPADNTDDATTTITQIPYIPTTDLEIQKTTQSTAMSGDSIAYTLTLTNNGPDGATGIITDTFPSWFTYVSSSPEASVVDGVLTYSTYLENGSSVVITITGTVTWLSWASIKNTATVASSITDTNPADNTDDATTTITQIPYIPTTDLEIQKTTQSTAMSGDSIAYTLTLTNNGPDGATGIITDTFPSWFTYVSSSPEASVVDGVLTYSTYLENGSSVVITITGTVTWLGQQD
jgi:uncharacterized repeat protein (TIGR01451 family)